MGSILVVGSAASLQLRARIVKAHEPMRVQAFPAQLAVERLDERIVGRLPWPREIERHAMRIGPEIQVARDEFTALVNAYALWIADGPANPLERTHDIFRAVAEPRINHRRELRKDIHHRQNTKLPARRQLVMDKIHGPDLVRSGCR